jgi:ribulose kinase
MAAALAAGVYAGFDEAARAMVAIETLIEPNPINANIYDELFEQYVDIYSRLNACNQVHLADVAPARFYGVG